MTSRHLARIRALEEAHRVGFNLCRALRHYAETGELPRDEDFAAMVEQTATRLADLSEQMNATVPCKPEESSDDWGR